MALNLSGTTGVSGVAGSVGAPSIIGDDANTGISFPAEDTIKFSTGGVERMVINNSGISGIAVDVNSPCFRAYRTSNQNIGNNSATVVQYNNVDTNVGSAYDTSTYTFTCPVGKAGAYVFCHTCTIDDVQNADFVYAQIWLNGSIASYPSYFYNQAAANNQNNSSINTKLITLAEGDTVQARAQHNEGTTEALLHHSSGWYGFKLAT